MSYEILLAKLTEGAQDDKEFYWRRGNYLTIRRRFDKGVIK